MRTVFKNCTLLDGTLDMQPKPGTDVAIENGNRQHCAEKRR